MKYVLQRLQDAIHTMEAVKQCELYYHIFISY